MCDEIEMTSGKCLKFVQNYSKVLKCILMNTGPTYLIVKSKNIRKQGLVSAKLVMQNLDVHRPRQPVTDRTKTTGVKKQYLL